MYVLYTSKSKIKQSVMWYEAICIQIWTRCCSSTTFLSWRVFKECLNHKIESYI
jgi:hypothetical protein